MNKPPIGIMPKDIWEYKVKEQRLKDVMDAIDRYEKAGLEPLKEWYVEYAKLSLELLPTIKEERF